MSQRVFKCTIGPFDIVDGFTIVDLLFSEKYSSVSCVEIKDNKWFVEILSVIPISEREIVPLLRDYKYSTMEFEILDNKIDWLQKSFENFKPMSVGNFYLYGPHLRAKEKPANKIAIEIAAATAFGTGEHPTTSRCLIACQTFFDPKIHKYTLDIGCGSGILSIALAKLGCKCVRACDNDPEAVRVTKENIKINNVSADVHVFQNKGHEFDCYQYDFIIANILSKPLIELSPYINKSLKQNGILVLSGFNAGDLSVQDTYQELGLRKIHQYDHKDWRTIVLKKV